MKRVVMLKGVNGAKRLKYAQEIMISEPDGWKRISAKDLLSMLGGRVSAVNGQYISKIRNLLITSAMVDGFNVIVDDPNLSFDNEVKLREIVHVRNKVEEYNGTGIVYEFIVKKV